MIAQARYKVNFYDTDAMAVVHHANYIRWFEIGRVEFSGRDYPQWSYGRWVCFLSRMYRQRFWLRENLMMNS